jgi:Flp pilus assembly protein TadG
MAGKIRLASQRGAVAVEFALVVPLLIAIVFGIVEFSRLYNIQITLSNAARDAARTMAVTNDTSTASSVATYDVNGLALSTVQITPSTGNCSNGGQAQATLKSNVSLMTGSWFNIGSQITLTGVGAMRCGG